MSTRIKKVVAGLLAAMMAISLCGALLLAVSVKGFADTAAEGYATDLDFTIDANERLSDFDSYYWEYDVNNPIYCNPDNPYGNGYYQAKIDHADVWAFTDRGLASKNNMSYSIDWLNNNSWLDNWASLLAKEVQTHFIIETTLSFSEAKFNAGNVLFPGYGGVQFNIADTAQAAVFLNGVAVYIDANSGDVIYRNSGAGHTPEHTDAYDPADYGDQPYDRLADHKLKVEVSSTGFKAYVNDVLRLDIPNATLEAELSPIREGRVGLVGVAVDTYFKDLKITPSEGTPQEYNFVVSDAFDGFDAYFYNYSSGYNPSDPYAQVEMPASRLWGKTQNGMSRLTAADKLAPDTDGSWKDMNNLNSLIYTEKTYRYFEAETDISFASAAATGMAGLQFGADRFDRPVYWTRGMAAYLSSADGSVTLRSHLGDTANGEIRAQDAYDPADYGDQAFDKNVLHNLHVKVTKDRVQVYVDSVLRIDYAIDSVAGYEIGMSNVGLYADSRTSFFKNMKINALNPKGEVVVLPESISIGDISSPETGKSYALTPTVLPADADKEVLCEVSGNALYKNGSITFLQAGAVTVTMRSAVEPSVVASKTFTVAEGKGAVSYDLAQDATKLIPYFKNDNSLSAVSGVAETLDKHWSVSENGVTRKAADGDSQGLDSNYAMLYLPGIYKNFELTFTMNDNGTSSGWAGVMFGKETYGSSQYSNGNAVNFPIQFSGYSCHGTQIGTAADAGNEQANYPLYEHNGDNLIRISVFGTTFRLYFNDMLTPVIDKTVEESQEGFIALYANLEGGAQTGASFKDIVITNLDENGEAVDYEKASTIVWEDQETSFAAGTATELTATADGTQEFVNYTSSDDSVVRIVNGNIAFFVKEGTADITAYHADGVTGETKTFTVTARSVDGSFAYDFGDEEVLSNLEPYYQAGEDQGSAVPEELSAHWKVENGVLTRVNDLGGVVSVAWSELYLDRTFENFEISFNIKAGYENAGWAGVMFGKTGKNSSFFFDGDGAYVSVQDASAKFWGTTVGNHTDAGNSAIAVSYDPYGWNTYKLKVFGGVGSRTAQLFINDMETPLIENVKSVSPKDGYVCLFATGAEISFKDVHVRYLDETGMVIPYVGLEEIAISNKVQTATVGDKLTLNVTLNPENATVGDLNFETSDRSVAIVNEKGEVSFINAGEVTITVISKDDPQIKDSMTVTVNAASGGEDPGTDPGTDKEPGEDNEGGCSSSVGISLLIPAGVCLTMAVVAIRKRRSE